MINIDKIKELNSIALPDGVSAIAEHFRKQDEERKQLFKSLFPARTEFVFQSNPHFVELERVVSAMREKWDVWVKPAQELARRFEEMNAPLREFQNRMRELTAPANEFAKRMQEFNAPFQNMMAEAQRQLNNPAIRAIFTSFKLQSRFWIVSDIALLRKIIDMNSESEGEIEQFLVSHYTENNWAAVEDLFSEWKSTPSLSGRVAIIEDCLKTVKLADGKGVNIASVVIPALIAQIDGMMFDLYELMNRKSLLLASEKKQKKNEILVESISQAVNFRAADMLHTVIIEGVFRHSDAIEKSRADNDNQEDSEFNIFRHKIMHGDKDFLNYGKFENLTRFFLYADFLMQLITKIENGHEQE